MNMSVHDSANSSTDLGEGNTKTSPAVHQDYPAIRWCFTLHRWTLTNLESLISFFNCSNSTYVFGEEMGKSGDTPHLQGYFEIRPKIRFGALKTALLEADESLKTIHIEKAKKPLKTNIAYCTKECLRVWHSKDLTIPKPVIKMTYDKLRMDQRRICDLFKDDEDPLYGRKVYWFWEQKGCWGKSLLSMYMIDQMGAFVVQGKNNDILCGISAYIEKFGSCPRIVIFDIPRCNENHVSYQAIESLKGGFFFSGKYESGMVRFNRPHVICFSNEEPEEYELTMDRWIIEELVHNQRNPKCKGGPLKVKNKNCR